MSRKGYWIAHVDITDPDRYKEYVAANAAPIAAHGGRFLVRAGDNEVVAGDLTGRHVVVEFKDYDTAKACYHSPEYQAAMKIRDEASTANVIIVEGYDGPQPGDA